MISEFCLIPGLSLDAELDTEAVSLIPGFCHYPKDFTIIPKIPPPFRGVQHYTENSIIIPGFSPSCRCVCHLAGVFAIIPELLQ